MLTVPALRVQQFNQELFLLNVSAADVERLVRFEVLGDTGLEGKKKRAPAARRSAVNWEEIERRVQTSEKAFQRPILRKRSREHLQCRDDGADLVSGQRKRPINCIILICYRNRSGLDSGKG